MVKEIAQKLSAQLGSIAATAAIAFLLAFAQSILESHGLRCGPPTDAGTAMAAGAFLRAGHLALISLRVA